MGGGDAAMITMDGAGPRQPLLTGQVVWFLICVVVAMTSFFLLLSVVPLYASGGDESSVAAGLTTGAMMLATVVSEFFTTGFLIRFGYRIGLATGIVLLGAPPLLLPLSDALPLILLVSLVRGVGLAITVVAGTSLAAALSPEGRRGEMLGVYGLGVSVPRDRGAAGGRLAERGDRVYGGLPAFRGLRAGRAPGLFLFSGAAP